MFRELTPKGVEVSDGFAITAAGYWHSNAGRTVFQTTRAILKTEKQS
jgi:phosphoenolpyruvate synthase/pyruvate phosphate dikinase